MFCVPRFGRQQGISLPADGMHGTVLVYSYGLRAGGADIQTDQ